MNSFLLSLVSPMLHRAVCGNFKERISKTISLEDVAVVHFMKLVRLGCGEDKETVENIEEVWALRDLADRLEMTAVKMVLEDVLLKHLTTDTCPEMLEQSEAIGLMRLSEESYKIVQNEFLEVSQTEGFHKLSEKTLERLLKADEVGGAAEEAVFEALVKWMTVGREEIRGVKLLTKIRYGVMGEEYLASKASSVLPEEELLRQLVGEAMAKRGLGGGGSTIWDGVDRLCAKWKVWRNLKGKALGEGLKHATFLAVDGQGRIVVSDNDLHQVLVFNRDGSIAHRYGSKGKDVGQFEVPTGVAIDRDGRIVVADCWNNRIQVLNRDGSVARCFGSEGSAAGKLSSPCGVAVDAEGHIIVVDSANRRVQVFTADGVYVRHFGSFGIARGQFEHPSGVAVDRAGRIVVTDSHTVQVFNPDGSLVWRDCRDGPEGVCVDTEGRIVVAERGKKRVTVEPPDGGAKRGIPLPYGAGSLSDVAIDISGSILVAAGNRVYQL